MFWFLQLLLIVAAWSRATGNLKLTLLHTNDMHARFDETNQMSGPCLHKTTHIDCYGGFARLKQAVSEARKTASKEGRFCLFLNAGDNFQGTPYYTFFKWNITADLLNRLDIDAMTLGNHEFDDGVAGLAPFLEKNKIPIVTTNVDVGGEKSLESARSIILKSMKFKLAGNNVCVVGYLTPETEFLSSVGKIKFESEIGAIKEEVVKLKSAEDKCHVIIGLGHSGFDVDKQIAESVPDIDVIVGGHTDTFLYSGNPPPSIEKPIGNYPYIVTQPSGKRVPVVQAYGYTKYLGELMLDWDDNWNLIKAEGNPLLLDSKIGQDKEMAKAVDSWVRSANDSLGAIVGTSTSRLEGTVIFCSCAECNLGNLIADAYVDYYAVTYKTADQTGWTAAPIGIVQAGGIRATIDPFYADGNITQGDVSTVMPFNNKLVKTDVTGAELKSILESSVFNLEPSCSNKYNQGRFLQVSGIQVTYDLSKPSGLRVSNVLVRCGECNVPKYQPVNASKMYGVILSDYLYNGGDKYFFNKSRPNQILDKTDSETLVDYLRRKSPVYPEVGSRITILNKAEPSSASIVLYSTTLCIMSSLVLYLNK